MSDAHCNNLAQRKARGLVTHDNTGGPFVVECLGCAEVYPSFHCGGGRQIADNGDYEDARCPHCGHADPEECENAGLAWNTQQLKINELQQRLTAADERADVLEGLLLQTNELLYAIQGDPGAVPSSAIDAMRGEVFTALKPADGFLGSTCNEVREEAGLAINTPCKACNGSACIDR